MCIQGAAIMCIQFNRSRPHRNCVTLHAVSAVGLRIRAGSRPACCATWPRSRQDVQPEALASNQAQIPGTHAIAAGADLQPTSNTSKLLHQVPAALARSMYSHS